MSFEQINPNSIKFEKDNKFSLSVLALTIKNKLYPPIKFYKTLLKLAIKFHCIGICYIYLICKFAFIKISATSSVIGNGVKIPRLAPPVFPIGALPNSEPIPATKSRIT